MEGQKIEKRFLENKRFFFPGKADLGRLARLTCWFFAF